MEPMQAFDDLYWMGTPSYDAEDVVIAGIKKLGFDPAKVKYVIVSHAHAGEVGGAFLFQSRYGSRIVMNDWDMVEESVNGYPTGKPKRDIVPTDGMKITVGNRNVTIHLTPGHTPGIPEHRDASAAYPCGLVGSEPPFHQFSLRASSLKKAKTARW
jgi:metallo-beta-lactamase class B